MKPFSVPMSCVEPTAYCTDTFAYDFTLPVLGFATLTILALVVFLIRRRRRRSQ